MASDIRLTLPLGLLRNCNVNFNNFLNLNKHLSNINCRLEEKLSTKEEVLRKLESIEKCHIDLSYRRTKISVDSS